MCGKCDAVEGNLCPTCEHEHVEVQQETADPWAGFGKRSEGQWSINSASGMMPEGFIYV
jgi:hypothetical protein